MAVNGLGLEAGGEMMNQDFQKETDYRKSTNTD